MGGRRHPLRAQMAVSWIETHCINCMRITIRLLRAANVAGSDAAAQYCHLLESIGVATARCHLPRPQQLLAVSTVFDALAGYVLVISTLVPCE